MASQPNRFGHDLFEIVNPDLKQRNQAVKLKCKALIKQYHETPEGLLAWVQTHGKTPVIALKKAAPIWLFVMVLLGVQPGFVPPSQKRGYQVLLKLVQWVFGGQGKSFDHGFFFVPQKYCKIGFLAHQLHHWMAYRSGLNGYTQRSQVCYKAFWDEHQGMIRPEMLSKMSMEELRALQEAIRRDFEALAFVKEITHDVLIPSGQSKALAKGFTHA